MSTSKKRSSLGLIKAIGVVLVLGAIALGVYRVSRLFQNHLDQRVEAAAVENLDKARALAQQGNGAEASRLLRPILARVDDPAIATQALLLQAELDQKAGNAQAAIDGLRRAAEDFPNSSQQPVAALQYAKALDVAGQSDKALEVYERIRTSAPPTLRAPALIAIAARQDAKGDRPGAYTLYKQAMQDADFRSEDWFQAARGFGAENTRRIFSHEPMPDSKIYRVEKGDSLTSIGIKLNTTMGLLVRANGLTESSQLHLNQNLKYTPKDFSIVVERSTLRLYLLDKGGIFTVYHAGLGKPGNETTPGHYRIGNKEKDPTWFKPGQKAIAAGAEDNELGTRWMPLIPEEGGLPTDLGIHGTIRPESVGKFSSMGCPRLSKDDVEELYDLVVRSTPVNVVDHWEPKTVG